MICDQSTPSATTSGPTDQPSQSPHDDDDDDDSPMMTGNDPRRPCPCLPPVLRLCCCCVFRVVRKENREPPKLDTPAVGRRTFAAAVWLHFILQGPPVLQRRHQRMGVRPKTPCCWEAFNQPKKHRAATDIGAMFHSAVCRTSDNGVPDAVHPGGRTKGLNVDSLGHCAPLPLFFQVVDVPKPYSLGSKR